MTEEQLSEELKEQLQQAGVDIKLSLSIMDQFNNKETFRDQTHQKKNITIPQIDGKQIIDIRTQISYTINFEQLKENLRKYDLNIESYGIKNTDSTTVVLNSNILKAIGEDLFPRFSFGVLNGGSATSYADAKKNCSFNENLYEFYSSDFNSLAEICKEQPKGITPAYLNRDGSNGFSFLELKMRALLLKLKRSGKRAEKLIFQMSSGQTDDPLKQAYETFKTSPALKDLILQTGTDITEVLTSKQPLITAFTHSEEGPSKSLFLKNSSPARNFLALPGGHGQCFYVLKDIFKDLYNSGKRFVSLGNVDNSGYLFDPVSLALLAVSGKPAGFDFSFKTAVDVKGGVLVREEGRLNCVDLGVGIDKRTISEYEKKGKPILFNCANGLFNLEYLIQNIDRIIKELPLRFSDQVKDAGRYSQAEQVTWEVIALMEDPLIFAVEKTDKFLAAKMLLETLLTSGYRIDEEIFPDDRIRETAQHLYSGLRKKLSGVYGLQEENNRWTVKNP